MSRQNVTDCGGGLTNLGPELDSPECEPQRAPLGLDPVADVLWDAEQRAVELDQLIAKQDAQIARLLETIESLTQDAPDSESRA
jgi:hypothetical protein